MIVNDGKQCLNLIQMKMIFKNVLKKNNLSFFFLYYKHKIRNYQLCIIFQILYKSSQNMKGLVTLITGGASGLGLACVKRFAQQGARVIICDLPSSKGNEIIQKWDTVLQTPDQPVSGQVDQSSASKKVTKTSSTDQNIQVQTPSFFPADVTNEQQIQDMFNKIKQKYGRLDVTVNCAGIGVAFRTYNINKVKIK
jgi:3-hydroxyacyl-CoA dehydrogenase/3-hydroxy-2-methylbutyryl-CoA dehydrogenase